MFKKKKRGRERERERKRKKLITQLYNKFKILTARMSYVIDPHDGKKNV